MSWSRCGLGRVLSRDGNNVLASTEFPVAGNPPKPSSGDVVLVNSVANAGRGAQRIAFCPSDKNQVGSVSLDRFNMLAYASAGRAPITLVNPDLAALAAARVNGQSGFSKTLELKPAVYDRCLEALDRIDLKDQKCTNCVCESVYNVRLAYRQEAAGDVLGQVILEHGFTTVGYPAVTDAADVSALQNIDLDVDTRSSLDGVIKQLLKRN